MENKLDRAIATLAKKYPQFTPTENNTKPELNALMLFSNIANHADINKDGLLQVLCQLTNLKHFGSDIIQFAIEVWLNLDS